MYALLVAVFSAFFGIVLSYHWILSLVGGYFAVDLLEGYYKVAKKTNIKVKK